MNIPVRFQRFAMVAVSAALSIPAAVLAQPSGKPVDDVIVVEAPLKVSHESRVKSPVMRTETVELSREVGFSDLDLTKHADVMELRGRVEAMAEQSCKQLEELFPLPRSDEAALRRCVERAVASAQDALDAAIANASP